MVELDFGIVRSIDLQKHFVVLQNCRLQYLMNVDCHVAPTKKSTSAKKSMKSMKAMKSMQAKKSTKADDQGIDEGIEVAM